MELAPRLTFLEKAPALVVETKKNFEPSAWREAKGVAKQEAEMLVSERAGDFDLLVHSERVALIKDLLAEFGAVLDNSERPLDNSQRFLVEELAGKLAALELEAEMVVLQERLEMMST